MNKLLKNNLWLACLVNLLIMCNLCFGGSDLPSPVCENSGEQYSICGMGKNELIQAENNVISKTREIFKEEMARFSKQVGHDNVLTVEFPFDEKYEPSNYKNYCTTISNRVINNKAEYFPEPYSRSSVIGYKKYGELLKINIHKCTYGNTPELREGLFTLNQNSKQEELVNKFINGSATRYPAGPYWVYAGISGQKFGYSEIWFDLDKKLAVASSSPWYCTTRIDLNNFKDSSWERHAYAIAKIDSELFGLVVGVEAGSERRKMEIYPLPPPWQKWYIEQKNKGNYTGRTDEIIPCVVYSKQASTTYGAINSA